MFRANRYSSERGRTAQAQVGFSVKHFAVISQTSPRYEDWLYVLGSDRTPVTSNVAMPATSPGLSREYGIRNVAMFYKLDITRITPEQRSRIVERIAVKWGLDTALVERDIEDPAYGVPILADDVAIILDERMEE